MGPFAPGLEQAYHFLSELWFFLAASWAVHAAPVVRFPKDRCEFKPTGREKSFFY